MRCSKMLSNYTTFKYIKAKQEAGIIHTLRPLAWNCAHPFVNDDKKHVFMSDFDLQILNDWLKEAKCEAGTRRDVN